METGALTVRRFDAVRLRDGCVADVLEVYEVPGEPVRVHVEIEDGAHSAEIILLTEIEAVIWTMDAVAPGQVSLWGHDSPPTNRHDTSDEPLRLESYLRRAVGECFAVPDMNCTRSVITVLGALFGITVHPQVLAAAAGMHGAGGHGAQCGLVEGVMMFAGLAGAHLGLAASEVSSFCASFAQGFEARYGSLSCKGGRAGSGVPKSGETPRSCEVCTRQIMVFCVGYVRAGLGLTLSVPAA